MAIADTPFDRRYDRTIRAWLLALLRYAITLDDEDRLVALAAASEIDKSGQQRLRDFCFFHRTSVELCEAVARPAPGNRHLLQRHLNRMSDPRMKRAFAAIFDLDQPFRERARVDLQRPKRRSPWKGVHEQAFRT